MRKNKMNMKQMYGQGKKLVIAVGVVGLAGLELACASGPQVKPEQTQQKGDRGEVYLPLDSISFGGQRTGMHVPDVSNGRGVQKGFEYMTLAVTIENGNCNFAVSDRPIVNGQSVGLVTKCDPFGIAYNAPAYASVAKQADVNEDKYATGTEWTQLAELKRREVARILIRNGKRSAINTNLKQLRMHNSRGRSRNR